MKLSPFRNSRCLWRDITMRIVRTAGLLMIFCLFCTFASDVEPVRAESGALEQLLDLFEKKGTLSREETDAIRSALAREREGRLVTTNESGRNARTRGTGEVDFQRPSGEETAAEPSAQGQSVAKANENDAGEGNRLFGLYRRGFCLASPDEERYSLCIGGLLQGDYRYYDYDADVNPGKNKFDLRKVRFRLSGTIHKYFDYKFEYEFQGIGSRNLLDAYVNVRPFSLLHFRAGQFKEPFGLELSSSDTSLFFAERSMGYYMTPQRDVGVMGYGSVLEGRILYAAGIFNGDGLDDATGGQVDSPEFAARVSFLPLKGWGYPLFEDVQVGGSVSYASIDRNNVQFNAKTAGLTTFFDVAASAKFNIIRDAGARARSAIEAAWAYGPFMLFGEYFRVRYTDVTTSARHFTIELEDYYAAVVWMLTGESLQLKNGVIQPIIPRKSLFEGGIGAVGVAIRYDKFWADESVYDTLITTGVSVREAQAYSIVLNWYLNAYYRFIVDYTHTEFDRPLLIMRDSFTGIAQYSEKEDVITARFQLSF